MQYVFCLFFYTYYFLSKFLILIPKKKKPNTVLYLTVFFPENAGYHWRVKKWSEELEKEGYSVTIQSVLSKEEFYDLLENNFFLFLIKFLHLRFWQIMRSRKYETIIIRRELLLFNDYGDLFLEKLLLKIHPNAILDFDDDLSESKGQPKEIKNWFGRIMMENGDKFNESLKLYKYFIVVSNHLKKRVLEKNNKINETNICIIPTCVDYKKHPAKIYPGKIEKFTFGWIGGNHNYYLLDIIIPILNKLSAEFDFKLLIIGGIAYIRKTDFEIQFLEWSLHNEVKNLSKIDIGLMPLIDDEKSRGKGGFKLIQYMGLGIVSIASPITINNEIVDHGINSFLANSQEDWESIIRSVLKNEINFQQIGISAQKKIEANYSFDSNKQKYLNFIEHVRNNRDLG